MRETQAKTAQQDSFQEKVLSVFQQSLTEEQRFLQSVLNGKIKTYSHEEIIAELRQALNR
ncbi:hypothetical protein [Gallibacterium anatis]|uniref:hypothetical protein n=1 Tax=Gallibacterium anatis TaxID=750 RepID=UPI0005321DD3|nr:hypothetical protein [Gallibacterium anatis]KGQ24462.1 hypothetical protein JP27_09195 [Gallibacterium anatis]KGQ66216.1 hypothetical protein IO49_06225 [Gallibacterium anatis]